MLVMVSSFDTPRFQSAELHMYNRCKEVLLEDNLQLNSSACLLQPNLPHTLVTKQQPEHAHHREGQAAEQDGIIRVENVGTSVCL